MPYTCVQVGVLKGLDIWVALAGIAIWRAGSGWVSRGEATPPNVDSKLGRAAGSGIACAIDIRVIKLSSQ